VTALADTSVLIDYLRGIAPAVVQIDAERAAGPLHASEMTRLEVLGGMRLTEERGTRLLLDTLIWHPVDQDVAERAAGLARQWRPINRGIDTADYAIAATALGLGARLLTLNVKHFPMFPGLTAPYEVGPPATPGGR
jgi:predicted nucleic acid-binding protein